MNTAAQTPTVRQICEGLVQAQDQLHLHAIPTHRASGAEADHLKASCQFWTDIKGHLQERLATAGAANDFALGVM